MKITLADGTQLECDYMDHSEQHRQANVRILNTPMAEVARIFSDHAKTVQLRFEGDYAAGFTRLLAMIDEGNAVRVVLGKE